MCTDLSLWVSFLWCLSHPNSHRQLSDASEGLCYLHSCSVIHGDLKGVCDCSNSCFITIFTPG